MISRNNKSRNTYISARGKRRRERESVRGEGERERTASQNKVTLTSLTASEASLASSIVTNA